MHLQGVAAKLIANGYKVALGSRTGEKGEAKKSTISVKVDVAKPEEVAAAFATTEKEFGAPANVVIFNGALLSRPSLLC